MPTPHKHAALIKEWADGLTVQFRCTPYVEWVDISSGTPGWYPEWEYRVKPEPKPDVVKHTHIFLDMGYGVNVNPSYTSPNIKFTFDGETQQLKAVELIKQD